MPVSHAVKLRLIQAFQQKRALEAATAQASRADEGLHHQREEHFQSSAARTDEDNRCTSAAPAKFQEAEVEAEAVYDVKCKTGSAVLVTKGGVQSSPKSSIQAAEAEKAWQASMEFVQPMQEATVMSSPLPPLSHEKKKLKSVSGIGKKSMKQQQQQQQPSNPKAHAEPTSRTKEERTIPVDLAKSGEDEYRRIGHIDAQFIKTLDELRTAIGRTSPVDIRYSRLLYQDRDSDWLMLEDESSFPAFLMGKAKRILLLADNHVEQEADTA